VTRSASTQISATGRGKWKTIMNTQMIIPPLGFDKMKKFDIAALEAAYAGKG